MINIMNGNDTVQLQYADGPPRIRDAANAVVAVAEQFDSQAVVLVRKLVKPARGIVVGRQLKSTSIMIIFGILNLAKSSKAIMIIFGILNLAKSSLRSRISSSAVHWADKTVKPQMSANNILTWALYNTIQYTQHTQTHLVNTI